MRATFLPGLSVELRANGQALKEYDDDDTVDGENLTATRYVEAVANTEFSVHVLVESNFWYRLDDLAFGIEIDGQEITSRALTSRPDLHEYRQHFDDCVNNVNGVGHRQVFTFGELKTTDESLDKTEGPKLKDLLSKLGLVNIWVKRGMIVGRHEPRDEHRAPSKIGETVPEKALKGRSISSRVAMKDAGTCRARGTTMMDYPYGREPIVKYNFKYRSHRDLQIEGIIPRSPSPAPLDELDLENMTREEAIEALRQQRARGASTTHVKREQVKRERAATLVIDLSDDEGDSDDGDDGGVTITGEGPAKKRARTSNDSGIDTIDLTDD